MQKVVLAWLIVGLLGFFALPWYAIEDGIWNLEWLLEGSLLDPEYATGAMQYFVGDAVWLWPVTLFLMAPLLVIRKRSDSPQFYNTLIYSGGLGLVYVLAQGFLIGISGWEYAFTNTLFGELDVRQFGLGSGALLVLSALLFQFTSGLAAKGVMKGDIFVVGAIGFIIATVLAFVFLPVLGILSSAFKNDADELAVMLFFWQVL